MKQLNVAVIGAGYWGPNLIRVFGQLEEVKLRTICDANQQKLDYIKRCVAIEGQKIEIIDKVLYVDGSLFPNSPYVKFIDSLRIQARPDPSDNTRDNWGPYIIPRDCYFMMGDNRDNSSDSRFWGPVHKDLIVGKPKRIYWSRDLSRIGKRIE